MFLVVIVLCVLWARRSHLSLTEELLLAAVGAEARKNSRLRVREPDFAILLYF